MDITALFAAIANDASIVPFCHRGVGEGTYSTKFYTGRLPRKVQPLSRLYTMFGSDGSPFVYLPLTNVAPSTVLVSNFGSLLTAV